MIILITARDVLGALDRITKGRVITSTDDITTRRNPFVVTKTSDIPGKAVTELPGLVYGRLDHPIKKIAVMMTLTESAIELAGATGVDALLAHHPFADASNAGGVLLSCYLDLYKMVAFELHEAFHGLHPGIAFLHGHRATHTDIQYAGIPGNILFVGEALPEVKTIGDLVERLDTLMDKKTEEEALRMDRALRKSEGIEETSISACSHVILGDMDAPVRKVLHIFPHTGFTAEHLRSALREHPGTDTLIASISHVRVDNPIVEEARNAGLNLVCGDSHALEIYENGIPLARALKICLPALEIVIFKERMSSIPLDDCGSPEIQEYARRMAEEHLV